MIRTKDLVEFIKEGDTRTIYCNEEVEKEVEQEYRAEIIKRLRAYDRICHDLKQMITTLSNRVDK